MLIELTRKLVAADTSVEGCTICGNDFELGSVYAVAYGDDSDWTGSMCPTCLAYLNRRKGDANDPTLGNWPERGWPSTEVLGEARRRYPEAMFGTAEELHAAASDRAADERICEASVVWKVEREEAACA